MKKRLAILEEKHLKLKDITDVIETMEPLAGALEFLNWLRSRMPAIVVSDTFTQFAGPLMNKLGMPTLFCNTLTVGPDGAILDYVLRQPDGKKHVAASLKTLNYRVIAVGDSYNDVTMLKEADAGILFNPPQNVESEFPGFPVTRDYHSLKKAIQAIVGEDADL
jgi:phosphoserine/homoserine phosphotransferase